MTTIESLPAENIAQIFKAASQLEFRQDNFSLPLTFLQCFKVSRRWYYIALQNPDLFTNIVIPFTALREQKYSISKWTKFWLEQSKTCTVTVTVRFDLTTAQARDLTIFRALLRDHIIPHASRLRAFHFVCLQRGISVSTQHFFDTSFILPVEAPNLEELVIRTGGGGILPLFVEPPGTKPLFMSSHKLRRLLIHGTAEIMFASLTGLTEFDASLVAISDTSFRKLVLGCPKLEVLALRALSLAKPTPEGDSAPISMDFLRSLTLDFIASNVVNIFTHILAPNLEYLEVSAGGRTIRLVNALPVASSLTKLRKLKLVGVTSRQSADTGVVDDSQWFRDLPSDSIEEIHLAHTSGELLGIEFPKVPSGKHQTGDDLTLQNLHSPHPPAHNVQCRDLHQLGNSRNYDLVPLLDSYSSSLPSFYTNLKSVTIESFVGEDMVWLCRLLTVRPNIQTVYLSTSALTALRASTLLLQDGDSGGWLIGVRRPGYSKFRLDYEKTKGMNLMEWVKKRVDLKIFEQIDDPVVY